MPTARKTAARPKKTAEPEEVPLLELTTAEPSVDDLVLVFNLDGVPYYAPKTGQAWMALEYLRVARDEGQDFAMVWLFETLLGPQAWEALRSHKGLTMTDLGRLLTICQKLILGSEEEGPKASRSRG